MATAMNLTFASESEATELLMGRRAGAAMPWPAKIPAVRMSPGTVGIFWRTSLPDTDLPRPFAIMALQEDHRRLFNRFAQLRSDVSPLSSWCHVISPELLGQLIEPVREANLDGYEAAWAGLVVAEALLLTQQRLSQIRITTCLATPTFASARSCALWGAASVNETVDRYVKAHSIVRQRAFQYSMRDVIEPIWKLLLAASTPKFDQNQRLSPVVRCIRAIAAVRREKREEVEFLQSALQDSPFAEIFGRLNSMTPEERVRQFDVLIRTIQQASSPAEKLEVSFIAGYLTTVMAGGSPSLAMAEAVMRAAPQVTAWAYLIGGLGEPVTWTSSFDGLGRLVVREMMRPFNLADAPSCDFALDEAQVVVDRQLADPLVHLRLKQSRLATVALLPGVNIPYAVRDSATPSSHERAVTKTARSHDSELATLADELMPFLLARLEQNRARQDRPLRKSKPKGESDPVQSDLPLDD